MGYIYKKTEPQLWTVGYHDASTSKFQPESDHDTAESAAKRVRYLNGGSDDGIDVVTARLYTIKAQRDKFIEFCRAVLPANGHECWDHATGHMFRQLVEQDRDALMNLLDRVQCFCPVPIQDEIRKAISKRKDTVHPSRLVEALRAIADPEHCLTENTVDGLRGVAQAALEEIDPRNDYSVVHKAE